MTGALGQVQHDGRIQPPVPARALLEPPQGAGKTAAPAPQQHHSGPALGRIMFVATWTASGTGREARRRPLRLRDE
jgi:hypothetical protein